MIKIETDCRGGSLCPPTLGTRERAGKGTRPYGTPIREQNDETICMVYNWWIYCIDYLLWCINRTICQGTVPGANAARPYRSGLCTRIDLLCRARPVGITWALLCGWQHLLFWPAWVCSYHRKHGSGLDSASDSKKYSIHGMVALSVSGCQ